MINFQFWCSGHGDDQQECVHGFWSLEEARQDELLAHWRGQFFCNTEVYFHFFWITDTTTKSSIFYCFVINFFTQLFMFFSQQGVTNDSFPCNTVAGSRIGGNSKDRQRSSLCHEYHLFCVRQKELFKVAPAPFLLSTWGSTTPSVAVWAGKKR